MNQPGAPRQRGTINVLQASVLSHFVQHFRTVPSVKGFDANSGKTQRPRRYGSGQICKMAAHRPPTCSARSLRMAARTRERRSRDDREHDSVPYAQRRMDLAHHVLTSDRVCAHLPILPLIVWVIISGNRPALASNGNGRDHNHGFDVSAVKLKAWKRLASDGRTHPPRPENRSSMQHPLQSILHRIYFRPIEETDSLLFFAHILVSPDVYGTGRGKDIQLFKLMYFSVIICFFCTNFRDVSRSSTRRAESGLKTESGAVVIVAIAIQGSLLHAFAVGDSCVGVRMIQSSPPAMVSVGVDSLKLPPAFPWY